MKKVLIIMAGIILALLAAFAIAWFGFLKPKPPPVSDEDRARVTLMPLPAEMKLGKGTMVLDASLDHQFTGLSTPRLERAVSRFFGRISSITGMEAGNGNGDGGSLVLECSGKEMEYPSFGDDESYTIRITPEQITVRAPMETGILYGLESLLQLLEYHNGQWEWPLLKLSDNPRYSWRGVMIDAGRHWMPTDVILRNLDAMAALKMNVFHWHLTDYQGFRVESKRYPRLHEMGSNGEYYTQEQIREVVEYAADRGIRVVPEFDLPGHSTSWFAGYPELASAPGPYIPDSILGVLDPVMDPTREEVYLFLDNFFGETAELFPDGYLHIGGDEVSTTQWDENEQIREFMRANGIADAEALQAYFNNRLSILLAGHGKKMMGWDEILNPGLTGDGIAIQTWRDHASLWESAHMDKLAVLSAGYYLDHKLPASYHYNVDPAVIPGAVDMEIDSANWRGWACTIGVSDMILDGSLYLFGEGQELRGIIQFMNSSIPLVPVGLDKNQLFFTVEASFGKLDFKATLSGDSLHGTSRIAIAEIKLEGVRSGGSDMEGGLPLPEFKKIEPLSPEEAANLIGGEACMWSEMVDGMTIESRIWPRAAAVGEKLWSPEVLTGDVEDMYRRLMVMDYSLEELGLQHRTSGDVLLRQMVGERYISPLQELVSVLEEDKYFNRMILYHPAFFTTTPLNRVVDAARPESYVAYRFARDVDQWIGSADEDARTRIIRSLESFKSNHERLAPAFAESEMLKEVEQHAVHLSALARLGLQAMNDPGSLQGRDEEIDTLCSAASEPYGGTILAVAGSVQKLLGTAMKN